MKMFGSSLVAVLAALLPLASTSFQPAAGWNVRSATSSSSSQLSMALQTKKPGTAEMDVPWEELGFTFRETNSHIKMTYKDGEGWGTPELVTEPYVKLHIGATALHYGQACFEGLKAFCHEDGSVNVFRPDENAKRMQSSCRARQY
jgi:hypothetical protein